MVASLSALMGAHASGSGMRDPGSGIRDVGGCGIRDARSAGSGCGIRDPRVRDAGCGIRAPQNPGCAMRIRLRGVRGRCPFGTSDVAHRLRDPKCVSTDARVARFNSSTRGESAARAEVTCDCLERLAVSQARCRIAQVGSSAAGFRRAFRLNPIRWSA
jgi:hypothetical protein